jgi:hypothetical protein
MHCFEAVVVIPAWGIGTMGDRGCTAVALVDSIAARRVISAESRAVADGVNLTFLLHCVSVGVYTSEN